ncbi:extracellular solute-binding protein [Auraticoccus sp. F435]|uniref:Extracellular solute-binding protein n=1 Tax=Auraticoccus cholistanensis TaxID=2656650 RepID=A0A6A9UWB1_9ACTN|nr:twin-arginine translocation signal domain-containing protein [Auraticoccus cholistanensis]MVA75507.1 extracellular solute-binding protein [Auraticoccus cholistanensis]
MSGSSSFVRSGVSRRGFLGALGVGASALTVGGLSGCGSAEPVPVQEASVSSAVLPTHVPVEYATPDIPSVKGSIPGYTTWPSSVTRAVPTPPGDGRTIKAMTPLWGTIPDAEGNQYYAAVNELIGNTIEFQITDGNVYGDKLATVLASPRDVPDWVSIPGWNFPPRFGSEIVGNVFADLTPYLAGDAVKKYPHLANIPTDAWKMCVFNGKLYGLPYPDSIVRDAIYYRDDLMEELGITVSVGSAEDVLALAQEVTDPSRNRWGAEDMWNAAAQMFGVVPEWGLVDGKLLNRVETEQYRAALDWTTKLFASGAVHPDAVAGQTGEAKQRFQAGRSLIMPDGVGGWHEALRDNLASNPTYSQRPFDPFPATAGGEIVYWKSPGAGMFSFIKKTDDTSMIEQILAAADVLAAPFGTLEFQTINYGVEGVHWEAGEGGVPKPTDLAPKELQPTYIFLADPPVVEAKVQYPGYVEEYCGWMQKVAEHAQEPPLYGMQITEPAQYASIGQPFTDLEADIPRGRKPLSALDDAIATWKASGGEELRAFYQNLLDQQ